MSDHRLEGPGENGDPVPRDMPDQQAGAGEDPWEAAPAAGREAGDGEDAADGGDTGADDTTGTEDEPTPDEPTG
ncbi:hypothetical protein [Streptomyces griseoaurantiacus]|uniref:hypothetical protein n=1 Tax=Streptomyces griseoaurantiacus TaxID=68213 RepID=UPI0036AF7B40